MLHISEVLSQKPTKLSESVEEVGQLKYTWIKSATFS